MAKVSVPGIEAYEKQLQALGREAPKMISKALFDGAGVLADAVKAEIPTVKYLKSERQIKGLQDGLGIARFWIENGVTQTKIGWEGYNSIKTRRWPFGQPNAMLARSILRGTSFMMPDKFTNRAVQKARKRCVLAIQERFERELGALTK